jgi:predicted O-linked N-acetylglucosamine transferase (SPINDLY family)
MEYSNEKQLMDQFEKPEMFTQRIETLKEQLPSILDDFNKFFVLYNTDPSYPEYGTMFNNIKQHLNSLSASLFMVSNDVDANTDEINKTFKKLDVLITKERRKNRELRRKLGIIEDKNNSSKELIDNYNEMYNTDYLRNWGLFLSTIVVGVSISKMFVYE